MKARKISATRCVVALALFVVSLTASAVQIRFDFSGTVLTTNVFAGGPTTQDHSNDGATFVAWITVETAGLVKDVSDFGTSTSVHYFDSSAAPELVSSFLSIGGTAIDVGMYANDRGSIAFDDSNGLQSCGPACTFYSPDSFSLGDDSTQLFSGSAYPLPEDGNYLGRALFLTSVDPDVANPNAPIAAKFDYFDLLAADDPLSVMTLPFGVMSAGYSETTTSCSNFICKRIFERSTVLNVSSVSRSFIAIPEPATFGLFSIGFLAIAGLRARMRRFT